MPFDSVGFQERVFIYVSDSSFLTVTVPALVLVRAAGALYEQPIVFTGLRAKPLSNPVRVYEQYKANNN